jgi:membrane fusion protein, multidrug efflux system
MNRQIKKLIIAATVACTIVAGLITYWGYERKPVIDDATIVSDIIQIASQIDGPIVKMDAKEYQYVSQGDLLYAIDPKPFEITLENKRAIVEQTKLKIQQLEDDVVSAQASLKKAQSELELAHKDFKRKKTLTEKGAVSQSALDKSTANLDSAESNVNDAQAMLSRALHALGDEGEKNAELRQAVASMDSSQLDLGYTKVYAPVNGYITNLRISEGSYVKKGEPAMTLISDENWRVVALVRETQLKNIQPGQTATIYLPAYPDARFEAKVYGIGWGIAPSIIENVTEGLTEVSPTLDWVRLAQRFPVQVYFDKREDKYPIRVGMTATVQIDTTSKPKNRDHD